MSSHQISIFAGIILLLIGCSFTYKCFQAMVLGRTTYWSGFLPLSLISPLFTHIPASKRSLIKTKEGLLVHIIVGPLFFVMSIIFLSAGADLIGWPGTATVNYLLNGGDMNRPAAVVYDKGFHYSFPILVRAHTKFSQMFDSAQIPENEKDKLLYTNR